MEQPQIIVRKAVRYDVALRGVVRPSNEHASQVRFSTSAGAREGWIEGDVVDFSCAGLGFVSTTFVPRRTLLQIKVHSADEDNQLLVEVVGRVQRVCMTDRRPAYLVGVSFEDLTPKAEAQVKALLKSLGSEDV